MNTQEKVDMKGIKPRGKGYEVTVTVNRRRERKILPDVETALAYRELLKEALTAGQDAPSVDDFLSEKVEKASITLQDLLDLTMKVEWSQQKDYKNSYACAKYCVDLIGKDRHPASVTIEDIDTIIEYCMDNDLTPATTNRKLFGLSKILRLAMERGYITKMPKIKRRKEPKGRIRFYTREEEFAILAECKNQGLYDLHDIVVIGIYTGFRMSEILRITAQDVVGNRLTSWVTKNGNARTVPLSEKALEVVTRRKANGKFFEFGYGCYRHQFNAVRKALGFDKDAQFIMHTMRHTFCSRLVQAGVNLLVVQQLAGHSSITMTARYAHLQHSDLDNAIAAMN